MKYEKIAFNEAEMTPNGEYMRPIPGMKNVMKPTYPISTVENFKRFLDGEPAWTPTDMEVVLFNPTIIPENVARGMAIEMQFLTPDKFGGPDFFGIDWEYVPMVQGSMVRPGKPTLEDVSEWENVIKFPDISQYDWEGCKERNKFFLDPTRQIKTTVFTGFFERLISFMDMENALIAMIDEDVEDDVKRLFDKLADFYIEVLSYMKKYFNVSLVWFHDDWGNQRAPMFSLETVRRMIVPALKKVVDGAHELGITFELHSCGKVEDLVPAMVEAGVDMWDGQYMNDKKKVIAEYGDKIKVHVMFSAEDINPSMSDDEIRAIICKTLDEYGKDIYIGGLFALDERIYPIVYEESRKRFGK